MDMAGINISELNQKNNSGEDITREFRSVATRVSVVSIIGNIILTVIKLLAGIFANSGAMISDAVHSASDVFSSFIVIIGVRMSGRSADKDHPYGHERFECVAALILALILAIAGWEIGQSAVAKIRSGSDGIEIPGVFAMITACVGGLAAVIVSTPLNIIYWGGQTGNVWGDAVFAATQASNLPVWLGSLLDELVVDVPDKLITGVVVYLIISKLPNKLTSLYDANAVVESLD